MTINTPCKPSTLREFFIITLEHGETRNLTPILLMDRVTQHFKCESVLVVRENYPNEEFKFNVGVKCLDASKNTALKKIKGIFPEFEKIHVQFKKGWGPIALLLTKQDKNPLVWGKYTTKEILEAAEACKHKKKQKMVSDAPETKKKGGRPKKD